MENNNRKIIDLEIADEIAQSGVSEIALVDVPAIDKLWMAFREEKFVVPSKGEHETEYMPRCMSALVGDEGKNPDEAFAICNSMWQQSHSASYSEFAKVSFDWDDTLGTNAGLELAKKHKESGDTLYIISARNEVSQSMLDRGKELGIPESRIYATGSNKAKVEKVKSLGLDKHIDNNADVMSNLRSLSLLNPNNLGAPLPPCKYTVLCPYVCELVCK